MYSSMLACVEIIIIIYYNIKYYINTLFIATIFKLNIFVTLLKKLFAKVVAGHKRSSKTVHKTVNSKYFV